MSSRRKTRKRKVRRKAAAAAAAALQRLLQCTPDLVVVHVLACLTDREVATTAPAIHRDFARACAAHDDQVWAPRCARLWRGKCEAAVVPFRDAPAGKMTHRVRYMRSRVDARRTVITEDELCGLEWAFRFKEAVGEDFVDVDPYWQNSGFDERGEFHFVPQSNGGGGGGSTARCFMRRRFLRKNKLNLVVNPGDEDALGALVRGYWGADYTIKWRFTKSRQGVRGQFVKLNHWPSSQPIRNRENWGWIIHNDWVVYAHPATLGHLLATHEEMEAL